MSSEGIGKHKFNVEEVQNEQRERDLEHLNDLYEQLDDIGESLVTHLRSLKSLRANEDTEGQIRAVKAASDEWEIATKDWTATTTEILEELNDSE